ncbi:MAG: trypsin-like serine protease [Pirellulales bacterium]|nr:trypsin-like serine protease [Pirellulales bacterium]
MAPPSAVSTGLVETSWQAPPVFFAGGEQEDHWKVVSSDNPHNHIVPPGTGLDGVVELSVLTNQNESYYATAALLPSGRHLLTAAHVVTDPFGDFNVEGLIAYFDLPDQTVPIYVTNVYIHPEFTGDFAHGADIAILELATPAPAAAERYDIYRGSDEVGKVVFFAGYGDIGTGAVGEQSSSDGNKHSGYNRYEALADIFEGTRYPAGTVRPASMLVYDFDSGQPQNDALGVQYGIYDLGLGHGVEASTAIGDSGGPNFINGKIAGITSYGSSTITLPDASPGSNASFGDYSIDTRVSAFASWIDSIVNMPPVLAAISAKTVTQGGVVSFLAQGSDPNPGTSLTYTLAPGAPAGASINQNTGLFTWQTNDSTPPGQYTFTVIVSDNGAPTLSDAESFTVTVNPAGPGTISVDYAADPAHSGKYIITFAEATPGTNALELRLNASGIVEYSHNGGPFLTDLAPAIFGNQTFSLGIISRINVALGIGNDTLTVSNHGPGGLVVPTLEGIYFDGGSGVADLVQIRGTTGNDSFIVGLNVVSIAGRDVVAGNVEFYELNPFGGNDTLSVDTVSEEADLVEAVGSRVDVRRGPNPQTASKLTINHVEFEYLGILAGGGNDTVSVRQARSGNLRPVLWVSSEEGIDLVEIELEPTTAGVTHFVDTGPGGQDRLSIFTRNGHADRVQVNGTHVAVQLGPNPDLAPTINFQYTNVEILSVLTAGGADTITVKQPEASGPFPSIVAIESQDEDDLIELEWGLPTIGHAYGVNAGGGQDRLRMFTRNDADDSIQASGVSVSLKLGPNPGSAANKVTNYTSVEFLDLLTAGGNDTITLQMPPVGTFPTSVSVESDAGDDSITIMLGSPSVATAFQINAGLGANDALVVHTLSGYDDIMTANSAAVLVKLGPHPLNAATKTINYLNIDSLSLYSGGGNDTLTSIEPAVGAFPHTVRLEGQDENDVIEVELGRATLATTYHVIGGAGSDNRLNLYTRSNAADLLSGTSQSLAVQLGPEPQANPIKNLAYSAIKSLSIWSAGGDDSIGFDLAANGSALSSVTIEGQTGNDHIGIILGADAITPHLKPGDDPADRLTLDIASDADDLVDVTGGAIEVRLGPTPEIKTPTIFAYPGFEEVEVRTGGGNDRVRILQPTDAAAIFIRTEEGDDTIEIPLDATGLPDLVEVDGGAGAGDKLVVIDAPARNAVIVVASTAASGVIGATALEAIEMFGGEGNDWLENQTDIPSTLHGGRGNDTLIGGSAADQLRGDPDHNVGDGAEGRDVIHGNGGDDLIYADGLDGSEGGADYITGGEGADTIFGDAGDGLEGGQDTILGGEGDDLLFGFKNNDLIDGGDGNDIIAGHRGADHLIGGAGRDVLIGGINDDVLEGGADEDLLIASAMFLDLDLGALLAIRDEWTSANDYATRIAHLTGAAAGGLNGEYILTTTPVETATILNDGAIDTLIGGSELDWYWLDFGTEVVDDLEDDEIASNTAA